MNQIIPFHYLISMSLDDGLTSVQKAIKKRKEKKNYDGNKSRHASTRTPFLHTFSSLFLTFFFIIMRSRMWVNFPPFRDLGLGWFHSTAPPLGPLGRSVAFLTGHFMWHTQTHSRGSGMLENGGVGLTRAVLEEIKLVEGRQKRETKL